MPVTSAIAPEVTPYIGRLLAKLVPNVRRLTFNCEGVDPAFTMPTATSMVDDTSVELTFATQFVVNPRTSRTGVNAPLATLTRMVPLPPTSPVCTTNPVAVFAVPFDWNTNSPISKLFTIVPLAAIPLAVTTFKSVVITFAD